MATMQIDSIVVEEELSDGSLICQSYYYFYGYDSEYAHKFQMKFRNKELLIYFTESNKIKLEWSIM
jgi:hypothetical protein